MRDRRIETLETDPDIFVTLKPGWRFEDAHCFGEYSLRDVRESMKRVKPCDCQECRRLAAEDVK